MRGWGVESTPTQMRGVLTVATTAALVAVSAAAVALAAFLLLRQRPTVGVAAALLLAGAYGAIWVAAIEAADVGSHCFH